MRKVIIYQISDEIEIEKFFQLKSFSHTAKINIEDLQIKVFTGYDKKTFVDALEIADYLKTKMIYRHDALNKKPENLNKALAYLSSLIFKENYDVLFLITYFEQARILPKIFAQHFNKSNKLRFDTLPGAISCIDFEKKEFSIYIPNTILN
ncbi:MAG: hypothetical protein ACLFNO_02690 [Parcubacteria group bacterium]